MNVVFSNISAGLIFNGKAYGELAFEGEDLDRYIRFFADKTPDILALSEVHLEDTEGNSVMAAQIGRELGLPYCKVEYMHPSHLDTSMQMGNAILSAYPIVSSKPFDLTAPPLTVDRPDGKRWHMHDKKAQQATLDTPDGLLDVINLTYFPFHHFNRRMDDSDFAKIRKRLVDFLLAESTNPKVIAADFNNKNVPLRAGFPELFKAGFREAVLAPTTVVGYTDQQLDHLLYQPAHFLATDDFAEQNGSDHYAIGAALRRLTSG